MKSAEKPLLFMPGDTIEYQLTVTNIGTGDMKDAKVDDPIPVGVSFVANSEYGENTEFLLSVNNGQSFEAWPVSYTVIDAKGQPVNKLATEDMVSHVRWLFPMLLTPQQSHEIGFRVRVL